MFPTGGQGGRDEPGPASPRRDLQRDPAVEERLHRKLQERPLGPEASLHRLPPAETKPDPNEDSVQDGGEETVGDDDEGSSNAVEHILKELKGINKIQEEISDLRQYLTSVRGSVDQVSYCVDTVLSEIGELCSGSSAAPLQPPVFQTPNTRRGSLGRQNAVTSSPPDRSASGRRVGLHTVQRTGREEDDAAAAKMDLCYMELHRRHDYQSTRSVSSCLSPEAAFASEDSDIWASVGMQSSASQEGGWSEEACYSLHTGPALWDRLATEEVESSTPGHSSHNSSEHLSLLFGHQYHPPFSWRHQRTESKEAKPACHCPVGCPYWSSGSHTADPCLSEAGGGPSRSVSSSTVQLTDCDDGYLEPSSGDALDLGSTDSLDRDWTDCSISRGEAGDALSRESSLMDLQTPSTSCDVTTFSRAVLTFRSALKVALKKLGSNPEDDGEEDAPWSADGDPEAESNSPKEDGDALVSTDAPEKPSSSSSPLKSPHSPTQGHFAELPGERAGSSALAEPSNNNTTPERWTEGQAEVPLGPDLRPDEARLSPIREIQGLDEVGQARPTDAGHRERIANFQRILREKRRARHRLSRSVLGSQSSHGSYGSHSSQGSQGSQSQEEVLPGTWDRTILHPQKPKSSSNKGFGSFFFSEIWREQNQVTPPCLSSPSLFVCQRCLR